MESRKSTSDTYQEKHVNEHQLGHAKTGRRGRQRWRGLVLLHLLLLHKHREHQSLQLGPGSKELWLGAVTRCLELSVSRNIRPSTPRCTQSTGTASFPAHRTAAVRTRAWRQLQTTSETKTRPFLPDQARYDHPQQACYHCCWRPAGTWTRGAGAGSYWLLLRRSWCWLLSSVTPEPYDPTLQPLRIQEHTNRSQ